MFLLGNSYLAYVLSFKNRCSHVCFRMVHPFEAPKHGRQVWHERSDSIFWRLALNAATGHVLNYLLRVIPTLKHYCDIVSVVPVGTIYGLLILTFYVTLFLACTLPFYPTFDLESILTNFLAYILTIFLAFYLAIFLASSPTFWHFFWQICICMVYPRHSFSHSIWYTFGYSLLSRSGGEHSDPELAVGVRRGTLWSGACGRGLELAVEVFSEHSDPGSCGGGPAGNICCLSPAGNTAI